MIKKLIVQILKFIQVITKLIWEQIRKMIQNFLKTSMKLDVKNYKIRKMNNKIILIDK